MSRDPVCWLVGEHNPYGPDPRYALYPLPAGSAGHRLQARVLGVPRRDYLDETKFRRVNVLQGHSKWTLTAARAWAGEWAGATGGNVQPGDAVVLLGRRVAEAFSASTHAQVLMPFQVRGQFVALPHPSGRCQEWNAWNAVARARAAILQVAPWLEAQLGLADGDEP